MAHTNHPSLINRVVVWAGIIGIAVNATIIFGVFIIRASSGD
jgi:hypothetical protein